MRHGRLLMGASALAMAALGLGATFGPDEFLAHLDAPDHAGLRLTVQAAGALYLGFAMLNWMARGSLIGGIYGRPVALGNFAHFLIGALALARTVLAGPTPPALFVIAAVYALFALGFGLLLFTHPDIVKQR